MTANGIDFKVEIDTQHGEIDITDVNDKKVAYAVIYTDSEQGVYGIFNEDGYAQELNLPRELYDNIADHDGEEAAYWLCSVSSCL
jgi:hypothetical protein